MSSLTPLKTVLLFVLIFCLCQPVLAGGFQINMLGMKATSMAGTSTGFGRDASAAFHNPGAMTFLEYSQLSLGAAFSIPSTSYLSPYTSNFDMDNKLYAPVHLYGVWKFSERGAVGISVNTPFHKRSKWDENWAGNYITIEQNVKALYVQPTFSYSITEQFGIGAGPVIALGSTFMSKHIPVSSSSGDILLELDGKSIGYGFNFGIFYKPTDEFSLGLNYRSAVKLPIKKGDATFSNVPQSLVSVYPENLDFETSQTFPAVVTVGAAMDVTRELTLCLDINYTMWDVYDSLDVKFKNHPDLDYGSSCFYMNAFAFRVGAQYKLNDRFDVRAGVAFDKSPVKDKYLSPENPDADRFMFSLGGSMKFGEHFSIDAAYMLQNIKEREAVNVENNFGGNYKSLINIFGVTLNYSF